MRVSFHGSVMRTCRAWPAWWAWSRQTSGTWTTLRRRMRRTRRTRLTRRRRLQKSQVMANTRRSLFFILCFCRIRVEFLQIDQSQPDCYFCCNQYFIFVTVMNSHQLLHLPVTYFLCFLANLIMLTPPVIPVVVASRSTRVVIYSKCTGKKKYKFSPIFWIVLLDWQNLKPSSTLIQTRITRTEASNMPLSGLRIRFPPFVSRLALQSLRLFPSPLQLYWNYVIKG